jgi:alkanesulfonate monooxygenase SsuD/methylene tetrahydromethanopterin reductase-like flavin-dependent oxidoreductase (luciferase family)
MNNLRFGIKTTPMNVSYEDIRRVWLEADEQELIADAWLWDHFLPLAPDPTVDVHEGWTLLAALAAQTKRLRLGLLVTSNAVRPPAVLAKMAATVDVISGGRLILGLGVGGTRQPAGVDNPATREYGAYGIPLPSPAEGIGRLDEACTLIRRLWREDGFEHAGAHYHLREATCRPHPVQQPGPPLLLGGWGDRTLGVVARHADMWNIPGPPHGDVSFLVDRSRALTEACRRIGRDPDGIVRSTQLIVEYDHPERVRQCVLELAEGGFSHFALALRPPYQPGSVRWLLDEVIVSVLEVPPSSAG